MMGQSIYTFLIKKIIIENLLHLIFFFLFLVFSNLSVACNTQSSSYHVPSLPSYSIPPPEIISFQLFNNIMKYFRCVDSTFVKAYSL